MKKTTFKPALFATVGGKIHRYAAVGVSGGYFALNPYEQSKTIPVTPVGIELTLTDFKTKKAFPVITAQWYFAHFKEYDARGSMYSHFSTEITGKYMFHVDAGVAFRVLKTKKYS